MLEAQDRTTIPAVDAAARAGYPADFAAFGLLLRQHEMMPPPYVVETDVVFAGKAMR